MANGTREAPTPRSAPGPIWTWGIPIALAVLTIATFWPTLGGQFLRWDDDENFTHNDDFGSLSVAGIRWALTTFCVGVYQPLGWLILEVEHSLWGLDARGYRAAGLAFQAINAVLLFRLIVALLDRCRPALERDGESERAEQAAAALVAAAFALHPLRVEAVSWASCQTYLPAILFAMLAVLTYLRAHPKDGPPKRRLVALSWFLALAAMLCKATASTLPLVMLILDIYPLRRLGHRRDTRYWGEKLAFLIPGLVIMVVAVRAKVYDGVVIQVARHSLSARLAQACFGACFYPIKTLWPARLSPYYPMPDRIDLLTWPFFAAAIAVIALTIALVALRRTWPGLLAAWTAYLVILAPNSGLLRVGHQITADRYAYLSTIPLVIPLAWVLARAIRSTLKRPAALTLLVIATTGVILGLATVSWNYALIWRNSIDLWTRANVMSGGGNSSILANLGASLCDAGDIEGGAAILREILRREPTATMPNYNLGVYLVMHERYDEAEPHFATAVRWMPPTSVYLADAHYNLGLVMETQGRLGEALVQYSKAAAVNPRDAATQNNLGSVLFRLGRTVEAEARFAEALRLRPGYALARRGFEAARSRNAGRR